MANRYHVAIKVISQTGNCGNKHKVGEEWVIKDKKTPGGICLGAFIDLLPATRVLMFGGALPWETDPDVAHIACPDANNPVVFELRRLRK